VRRPSILLLDEPTSALDPRHQIDVMQAVRESADSERMIVLAVLHDLNLALRWADMVLLLANGTLAAAGPPETAVTADTVAETYHVVARIERCSQGRLHVLLRRRLTIGSPRCLSITSDERQVSTLLAAAQAGAQAQLEANLRWLARPDQRHVLQIATGTLATALNATDLRLALPAAHVPTACDRKFAVA
jgi:ABC-type multidrug transport system ATPase subunit